MPTTHINNFKQLYEMGAWFGDTYMEKLQDITEKEAFTSPAKGVHSIAELISHVIYWRMPVIKALKGDKGFHASVDSPENWIPLDHLKVKGWKGILSDFEDSQKQLVKLLTDAKPEFFKGEYSPGNSWEYVTEGIVQHDIYHLGQLGLVKKMLRNS
jgi:uncharacterized damage-inducible protein DinB